MTVFVFGNADVAEDSLPIAILPRLRQLLPEVSFTVLDPHEEWDVPERVVVLDTVQGLSGIRVMDGLDAFQAAPRLTMHDFDALANLRFLQKLGKIRTVTVVGVPPRGDGDALVAEIARVLRDLAAE